MLTFYILWEFYMCIRQHFMSQHSIDHLFKLLLIKPLKIVRYLLMVEVARGGISPSSISLHTVWFSDTSQVSQFCKSYHEGVPPELPAQLWDSARSGRGLGSREWTRHILLLKYWCGQAGKVGGNKSAWDHCSLFPAPLVLMMLWLFVKVYLRVITCTSFQVRQLGSELF